MLSKIKYWLWSLCIYDGKGTFTAEMIYLGGGTFDVERSFTAERNLVDFLIEQGFFTRKEFCGIFL